MFRVHDIGVKVSMGELASFLNGRPRGGFIYLHHYTSSRTGETANHWVKLACSYPGMVQRSMDMIDSGGVINRVTAEGLEITRGIWVDGDKVEHTKEAKGRAYQTIRKTYSMANGDDRRKVEYAIDMVRYGLVMPKEVASDFVTVAKGAAVREGMDDRLVYFRGCIGVGKVVVSQVNKDTASHEHEAIKEAIRGILPIGRYRTFKLEDFAYVGIDGQAILRDSETGWLYLSLKEDVKKALREQITVATAQGVA